MSKRIQIAMTGVLVLLMTALIVCFAIERRDQSFSRLRRAGIIRVGYAIEAPFAFLDAEEVTGAFPEITRRVVNTLGIPQIKWIQADFDELIPALESGRIDVAAAGLFITKERARRIAFSEPAIHVQQGLLVQEGNPLRLHSYQAAATRPDIVLAVIAGAVEDELLRRMGISEPRIIVVPDALTGRVAVESGRADGLALSAPTIRWIASHSPATMTEIAIPFEQPEPQILENIGYCAFAFRQSDRRLRSGWNRALHELIPRPEYVNLITAFGFAETELPGNITTAEILAQ